MNQKMIENWNNKIKSDDWVYILGDFCWGKENEWIKYLKRLNGVKTLIKGNHDLKQYGSNLKRYFQDIKDYKEIRDEGRGVRVSMSIGNGDWKSTDASGNTQIFFSSAIDGCHMTGAGDTANNFATVDYDAIASAVSEVVTAKTVANVVFVVEFDTVD